MMPRYALYPGPVTSRTDGQRHHVGADRLAHLYGVDLRDCLVVTDLDLSHPAMRGHCAHAATLVALRPRYDGDYSLPQPKPAPLVASFWSCPACGHSQRGGPPAICPADFPLSVCPVDGGRL